MPTPCELISQQIGLLFSCAQVNDYTRIRTPFLYPDGDVIDLFAKTTANGTTISDLGESLRWLRSQGVSQKRTVKQNQLIDDICLNHGIERFKGMLMVRVKSTDDWATAVTRLGQASVRVADLWFTFRTRAIESLTDEVADLLVEKSISFERGETLVGRSSKVWSIDFHTRTPKRSSLINVLSTGSRGAARGVVDHTVATWYDLSYLKTGPEAIQFISLFDDTMDVWNLEDFNLVSTLSEISYWSRTDDFIARLSA